MELSPDWTVYWAWGWMRVNATIAFTWCVMLLLVVGSWLITRSLVVTMAIPRWQNLLEVLVGGMRREIEDLIRDDALRYLPFLGTLFVFILTCNLLAVVPGFRAPTGSLSTTTALALCVFVAAPVWGIRQAGLQAYLRNYLEPSWLMLPFNVIAEITRTLALAVRLFGNVMSGAMIGAILLAVAPLLFPIPLQVLGLVTGAIQAYIFALLAAVYIAAAVQAHARDRTPRHRTTTAGRTPSGTERGTPPSNG